MEQNQIKNALLHPLRSAPSSGEPGQVYYNELENIMYKHDGEKWSPINIKPNWNVEAGNDAEILNKPTKLSQFENDSNFATKDEVNSAVGSVVTLKFMIVSTLPIKGQSNVVYLVLKSSPGEQNVYSEYIWVEDEFELIGDMSVDLTNYLQKDGDGSDLTVNGDRLGDIISSIKGGTIASYTESVLFDGETKVIQHNLDSTELVVSGIGESNQNVWIDYRIVDRNSISIATSNIGSNVVIYILSGKVIPNGDLPTGGTTGQVLMKNSDADYDVKWGDQINYTAGDGISIVDGEISAKISQNPGNLLSIDSDGALYVSGGSGGPVLERIEITTPPNKTEYTAGETFDSTGMVVTAYYSTGSSEAVTGYTISPSGELTEDVTEVTISYSSGGILKTATQIIVVNPIVSANIYGVSWDGTSTTKWTRTDGAALFVDPVPYVSGANSYSSPFDDIMPWSGMVKSERTGGTMVAIPKFWYKLEQVGSGMSIQIANEETEGFSVSPTHMNRGDGKGERDVVYIGRYHCGSDYKSKTGVMPEVNTTRSTARSSIHSLGDNYWQMDFAMRFTIWLLYIVEFADWNSQEKIGYGCGNGSSAQNVGNSDSMPYHTGTMQLSRETYGVGVQYRNIEGLWENVYDWMDGCYYDSNGMNIILNPDNFSDSDGGTSVGIPSGGNPSAFRVVSILSLFPTFIPSDSEGNLDIYSCDYWGFLESYPCLRVGGRYEKSKLAGIFYVHFNLTSQSESYIGCRIQELP